MDLKRHSYQCTVRWTIQGLTEPFLNIVGCCNFTEAKIGEVCTGQGTISQSLQSLTAYAYLFVQGNRTVLAVKNALSVSLFMFHVLKL